MCRCLTRKNLKKTDVYNTMNEKSANKILIAKPVNLYAKIKAVKHLH